jgi:hypothetical protein
MTDTWSPHHPGAHELPPIRGGVSLCGRLPGCNPRVTWIAPIPGTTKVHRLDENVGADRVELTTDDLQRIEDAVAEIQIQIQIQGARYTVQQLKAINR